MMKWYDAERVADEAEGVDIGFVRLAPAVKCDPELVRAPGRGQEFGLVDPQRLVEHGNRGDCRLTDADNPDLIGFDERDREARNAEPRQRGSGHPPRRAASN